MVQPNVIIESPTIYPFLNTTTNKVEYLTEEEAAGRDDVRHIRPGEKITPDQMPDASA